MGQYTEYHKDEAIKNAIALEDHLNRYKCPECIDKHSYGLEQYIQEESQTNPQANHKKLNILAELVRKIRKEIANTMRPREEEKLRRIY
jgi:hypothetical protein